MVVCCCCCLQCWILLLGEFTVSSIFICFFNGCDATRIIIIIISHIFALFCFFTTLFTAAAKIPSVPRPFPSADRPCGPGSCRNRSIWTPCWSTTRKRKSSPRRRRLLADPQPVAVWDGAAEEDGGVVGGGGSILFISKVYREGASTM